MSKRTRIFLLGFLFFLGLFLRLLYFKDITFTWDQARDAFQALNIWKGDFVKIIGPSTAELPGLHHGPLYWYLISPFYHFTNGNIYVVRMFLILLNLSGIFIIYHLTTQLFKNQTIAILSSFLFAISFEVGQYGRWMSNPAPALLTIPLTFLGLWYVYTNKKWGIPLTLISWAFSVHFQFFLVYQLVFILPLFIWYFQRKNKKITKEDFIGFLVCFIILLPFIVAEIKFNFQGLKAFTHLFEGQEFFKSNANIFFKFINRVFFTFYFNIFGFNLFFAKLIVLDLFIWVIIYIFQKKQSYKKLFLLVIWLLSPVVIFLFNKAGAYFVTIGILYPAIILSSFFIIKLSEKIKYPKIFIVVLMILTFSSQLIFIVSQNKTGESLFAVQKSMILSDQLKVIDYIYQKSNHQPFAINTVSNPLFINTTWSYLFNWYGKKKFGYMPSWIGYPQEGQFGSEVIFSPLPDYHNLNFFLIVEPRPGIPEHMVLASSRFEDTRSKLIDKKNFGGFVVEYRRLINNNNFDTQLLYKTIK